MDVLVVDDEFALRAAVRRALSLEGYAVSEAASGEEAIALLGERRWDVMVLDVLMPGLSGLEVCERLREGGDRTPILMLTARETVEDRVAGLEAGADDYLVKPFALEELLARVKALLRRSGAEESGGERLRFGPIGLDMARHEAWVGERRVELTRTEFSLLALLMRNPGQVLWRAQINEQIWGYDFGPTSNSLGVYIGYLRRKLEADGAPRLIQTIRGVGYVLRMPRQ
jgi:two-component system response regulator MprA